MTIDNGRTDCVNLVVIGGHGVSGMVFAKGGATMSLKLPLVTGNFYTGSNRLKYILIPACMNLSKYNCETWLEAMRRDYPVHGFLGYRQAYPGGKIGQSVFEKFTRKLKEKGGANTILDSWRTANNTRTKDAWGALLHENSTKDTMKDWLSNKLITPNKKGEIRWYCEENYPNGEKIVEKSLDYTLFFCMDKSTRITYKNNTNVDVGLFLGKKGFLEISKKTGYFNEGDVATITFYYYRPDHRPGLDLPKLLTFDESAEGGTLERQRNLNVEDKEDHIDGIKFKFNKDGLSKVLLEYTVNPEAFRYYGLDAVEGTRRYGYFWMKLSLIESNDILGLPNDILFYINGAYLREPKSEPN